MEKEFFNETPIITPLDCDNDYTSITDPTLATTDEVISAEAPCDTTPNTTPETPAEVPAPLVPTTPDVCQNPITIGSFFGTIQECITIVWRFHLKTRKYSVHKALNDFYTEALDIVDDIIEQYQGINGVVEEPFINCVIGDDKTEILYLNALKDFVNTNECILGDHSELKSTVDNFKALIDSTIYQLTSFTEHSVKSYDEFCYENLNESCSCEHCNEDEDDEENTEYSGEEEEE